VKAGKCKLLVLAPNIEEAEGERGTNAKLRVMLSSCSATATPVALALTRSKLGSAFKERKASSVAVLDTNGTETEAKAAKEEAESGRKRFKELFPEKIAELKQIFHPDNSPVPQALRKF
jgi:ribosomal protein L7Ae-like RNA K-turn-binding protein